MRGKGQSRYLHMPCTGITPAYAGKSSGWRWVITISQDHPRLCGEKFCSAAFSHMTSGSPPPMRGKEAQVLQQLGFPGITPAYAGKSSLRSH